MRWDAAYGRSWFVDPTNDISMVLMTNTPPEGMNGPLTVEVRDAVYAALPA